MKKINEKQYSEAKRAQSIACMDYNELSDCHCTTLTTENAELKEENSFHIKAADKSTNLMLSYRKALVMLQEMITLNGANANTVMMHEVIDEALKEV